MELSAVPEKRTIDGIAFGQRYCGWGLIVSLALGVSIGQRSHNDKYPFWRLSGEGDT
jgi:hypothetical protein